MPPHPPEPYVVHPLPPAPVFLGRDAELALLDAFWGNGDRGVLSLVGLGGAGKTALAARFLSHMLSNGWPAGGLFVWSFYQEPDAGLFLRELFDYFGANVDQTAPGKGAGLLHLLSDAFQKGGRRLLILDGLERVQRQASDAAYGQIEDPLLRSLLLRIAEGLGQTALLATSRFPLTDLAPWQDNGYRQMDVGELTLPAAMALLRRRGVRGDDETLSALVTAYGAHALTLDHLGSLIGQFLDGDPNRAPEAPALSAKSGDRQALRLARLLSVYERHLPAAELTLLCRLCMLRRSVREEQLIAMFLCSPPIRAHAIRELIEQIARRMRAVRIPGVQEDNLRFLIGGILERALATGPLAGPEDSFQIEILVMVVRMADAVGGKAYIEIEELIRQYARAESAYPTEKNPLPAEDRSVLRFLYGRYRKLRDHPLLPFKEKKELFKEKKELLSEAFASLGWDKQHGIPADLGPVDVLKLLRKVECRLHWLALKHETLRRVHELCRLHRQKWVLAGPLASLDAAGLRQVLDALVSRHLVLRESDGSFTAHPAVRDHFARLGSDTERGRHHELLRQQLMSLVHQPGMKHPQDRVTLDLVEEAIYHALEAGQTAEAFRLYEETLGGLRHLGWKLGEMVRGLRILRGFKLCPDRWALGWFLRALGEFEEAYAHNDLPYFRADIRLLQGRLPEVACEGESTRTATAEFLMGRTTTPPPSILGCAVPRAHTLLYLHRLTQSRQIAHLDPLYQQMGYEGDRARCQLLAAEAARRLADSASCRDNLQAASAWILHSGSVEHLCLYHLVRARAACDTGQREDAQRAVNEGLLLARVHGLGLYHIELLCLQGEISLERGDAPAAERLAREALWRATANDCRFAWGEAGARDLLTKALIVQNRFHEAREAQEKTLQLRQRIGASHPNVDQ
ncbi:MAG TPA: hypothetical protein VE999_18915 [Gemmataceae bacterium]|nr:hypothetical protein [Gemmataceae bacterium]